jgi:hypothetical protein
MHNSHKRTLRKLLAPILKPTNVSYHDYFNGHTHCTTYENAQSDVQKITASVIQGSAIGPASYVVCASDLEVITTGNVMVKYADVIIPACNITTRETELDNVENWARIASQQQFESEPFKKQ